MGDGRGGQVGRGAVLLVPVVLALGWLATRTHQLGHDWGDDFALYIRQARSLVDGFPHQVEDDNRFALAASGWSTFSPPIYPWGWPFLMAPVVALVGVDYEVLKALVVLFWCLALGTWFLIVRERTTALASWALLFALGLSWPYVSWTNSVVSDIPYLGVAFAALWWMDRCRSRQAFDPGRSWPLVVLGLALALGFNIRRDGLALVVALAALVLVNVVTTYRAHGLAECRRRWTRWATPFAVFVLASAVFQMLLPSVIAPRYPGTGLSNVDDRLEWYRDIFAEQVGLLSPDSDVIRLFGSHTLGMVTLTAIVVLAIVGVIVRCVTRPETDLPLAAFGLAHTAVVLIAPFQEGRYLFPIVPIVLYFALQSLPALASMVSMARPAAILTTTLVATLALSSARDTMWWADLASDYNAAGEVMNGPARPESVEMAKAVTTLTGPDDVVAFFRARAMTMMTDRRSLQAGSIEPILAGADWYVMERGSTYSQPLLGPDDAASLGLVEVWSNERFVLYRLPAGE